MNENDQKTANSETTTEKIIHLPSEFATFVKDAGVRAFDALATKLAPDPDSAESPSRLQRLSANWKALSDEEKTEFFAQMVAAASVLGVAGPIVARAANATRKRLASRRKQAAARRAAKKSASSKTPASPATKAITASSSPASSVRRLITDLKKKKVKKDKKAKKEKKSKDKKDKKDKKKAKNKK